MRLYAQYPDSRTLEFARRYECRTRSGWYRPTDSLATAKRAMRTWSAHGESVGVYDLETHTWILGVELPR